MKLCTSCWPRFAYVGLSAAEIARRAASPEVRVTPHADWSVAQWGDDDELRSRAQTTRAAEQRVETTPTAVEERASDVVVTQHSPDDAAAAAKLSIAANAAAAARAEEQRSRTDYKMRSPVYVREHINLGEMHAPMRGHDGLQSGLHFLDVRSWHRIASPDETVDAVKWRRMGPQHGEVCGHVKKPAFQSEWVPDGNTLPVYIWSLDRSATVAGEESHALSHMLWECLDPLRHEGEAVGQAIVKASKHVVPLRGTFTATGERTGDADGAPSRQSLVEKYPLRSSLLSKHRSGGAHGGHRGLLETFMLKSMDPLCKGTPPRSRVAIHPVFFELPDRSAVVTCVDAYMQISGGSARGKDLNAVWSQERSCSVPRFGAQVGGSDLHRHLSSHGSCSSADSSAGSCDRPDCASNRLCKLCRDAAAARAKARASATARNVLDTMTAARSASAFVLTRLNQLRPDLETSAGAANFTCNRFVGLLMEDDDAVEEGAKTLGPKRKRPPRFEPDEAVMVQYPGGPQESPGGWLEDDEEHEEWYWPCKAVDVSNQSAGKTIWAKWYALHGPLPHTRLNA